VRGGGGVKSVGVEGVGVLRWVLEKGQGEWMVRSNVGVSLYIPYRLCARHSIEI
jgi:hypothetical protein